METTFIHFGRDEAKVKSFSTASGAKSTRLTIVLEVSCPHVLSRMTQELHTAQHPPKPPPPPPMPRTSPKSKRLALPAPPLSLPYFGDTDDA